MKIQTDQNTLKHKELASLKSLQRKLEWYSDSNPTFLTTLKNVSVERLDSMTFDFVRKIFPSSNVLLVSIYQDKICSTPLDETDGFFNNKDSLEESEMDLMGQPLECPFNLSDIKSSFKTNCTQSISKRISQSSEIKRKPLSISDARIILNAISSIIVENKYEESIGLPFCILCDTKDRNRTYMIGCGFTDKGDLKPFTVELIEGTTAKGLPSLDQLTSDKNCLYPNPDSKILESVFSSYNFTNGPSSIMVECFWEKPEELLCIPSREAVCNLRVKLAVEETGGPFQTLFKELTLLRNAVSAIETGEMVWLEDGKGNETTELNVVQKVKDLIKGTREGQARGPVKKEDIAPSETKESNAYCFERIFIANKPRGDFTTHLWSTLQSCQSLNDLEESLRLVCDSVSRGELNPHVFHNNPTKLAIWIKKTEEGSDIDPLDIGGVSALKLLIEIGVEKLWKDYCAAFLGLATLDVLYTYFQPLSNGLKESVNSLLKIHYTLDFIVFCQYSLAVEFIYLNTLTSRVLKETSQRGFSEKNELIVPIELFAVLPTLIRSNPDKWEINYKVIESEEFSRQILCQLSQTRILKRHCSDTEFFDETVPDIINNDETLIADSLKYYGFIVKATENGGLVD